MGQDCDESDISKYSLQDLSRGCNNFASLLNNQIYGRFSTTHQSTSTTKAVFAFSVMQLIPPLRISARERE